MGVILAAFATAAADTPNIQALLKDLGDQEFDKRQKAIAAVRKLGATALPDVLKVFDETKDADLKQRLGTLLEPPGLRLKAGPELLKGHDEVMEQIKPSVDAYLAKSNEEAAAAKKVLVDGSPQLAIAVKVRLAEEKDFAARLKLHELIYAMLEDSEARADLIMEFAKCLHSCASNCGPYAERWNEEEVLTVRARGKTFHAVFVKAEGYADSGMEELRTGSYSSTPFMDLPASGEIYKEAESMYLRMANESKDPIARVRLRAKARGAKKQARAAFSMGAIVN
jgi:hypothetical protein